MEEFHYKTCKRYNTPNHAHALTFSCFRRQALLLDSRICGHLSESIMAASKKHNFSVISYVFMPEHVHLLIFPEKQQYSISKILQSIKQPVSMKEISYLKKNDTARLVFLSGGSGGRKYTFWQEGGGYDRNINDPMKLCLAVEYILHNPVRKRFVESPVDWEWSSAVEWYTGKTREGRIPVRRDVF